MNLISAESVNDSTAGFLKDLRIIYITFLVKSCPKFHKNDYFFSVLTCLNECVDNLALIGKTIQRHLDRNYVFIFCRLIKKGDKRLDTLIWVA